MPRLTSASRGYEVHDRSKNRSFDLECTRSGERLLVEVKGTTTSGDQVLLTKNEVKLAQDPEAKTVLFNPASRPIGEGRLQAQGQRWPLPDR